MKNINQPINITITAGTIIKTLVIILMLYFAFIIKDLLLILLASIVIASSVEPGTKWLMKRKLPRIISVLVIYISIMLVMASFLYFFLPPLVKDTTNFINTLPDYIETLAVDTKTIQNVPAVQDFLKSVSESFTDSGVLSSIGKGISGATFGFLTTASAIFGGIMSFVLIIVLSFYLSVQEDGVANFLKIITPIQHEKYILDLWKRAQRKIGLWMQGQLVLAVLIGVLTYLGLSILGIENALLLAVIAAAFELIPVFGPILAAVPAAAFGFVQGGPTLGFLVIGLYVIIQQFESQLIHPLVVKKIIGIPALIAIVSLIIGAQLAGFLGIILSVPVAAVIMEYLGDIERRKKDQFEKMSI
ncbi:AI-2E family transporter [Candidatus Parcubacteria bacterium]|nr:AI-2E family transporter [Candidatus Parcubacteria bacterium]